MRYGSLDGLRGMAALIVVVSHWTNRTGMMNGLLGNGAGQVGVMLFFVLSGFLMADLYLDRDYTSRNVAEFARRRFARIAPLYIFVIVLSYLFATATGHHWPLYPMDGDRMFRLLTFWRGDGIFWTVPVEVQFYALFPAMWFASKYLRERTTLALIALIALLALGPSISTPAVWPYAGFFLAGMVAALLPRRRSLAMDFLFLACLALLFLSFPRVRFEILGDEVNVWESPWYLPLVTLLIVTAVNSPLAEKLFGSAFPSHLGRISYSVYLLHLVVFELTSYALPGLGAWAGLGINLLAVILAATITFYLIERPANDLFSGRIKPVPFRQREATGT